MLTYFLLNTLPFYLIAHIRHVIEQVDVFDLPGRGLDAQKGITEGVVTQKQRSVSFAYEILAVTKGEIEIIAWSVVDCSCCLTEIETHPIFKGP